MSVPRTPLPAKLVVGLLYGDPETNRRIIDALIERFGPPDFLTEPRGFAHTSYYDKEMGSGLFRQNLSFHRLVPPETLPGIKLFTNELETRCAEINIDPGILNEERFVLATGKNFTHRIYLGEGIYADLTLIYQGGAYQVLPWTYPDHRDPELRRFFGALRHKLAYQRKGKFPRKGFLQGETL